MQRVHPPSHRRHQRTHPHSRQEVRSTIRIRRYKIAHEQHILIHPTHAYSPRDSAYVVFPSCPRPHDILGKETAPFPLQVHRLPRRRILERRDVHHQLASHEIRGLVGRRDRVRALLRRCYPEDVIVSKDARGTDGRIVGCRPYAKALHEPRRVDAVDSDVHDYEVTDAR